MSLHQPTPTLEESYGLCEIVARTRARNFYFSFLTLPREKRRAMCAVYAFLRYCDDLADDENTHDRAAGLAAWRQTLRKLEAGDTSGHPMMAAVADTVLRYQIPLRYFEEVIDGAEMDLSVQQYASFEDLYRYCYRVASAVGLIILRIYGATGEEAERLGEWCGIAFQLTNIIRDVREDARSRRCYLPLGDLHRFGCKDADLESSAPTRAVKDLLRFEAARAQIYYEQALPLLEMIEPETRASLSAMICIYHRLLWRIHRRHYDVFRRRVSVPAIQKLWIAFRCWINPAGVLRDEVRRGLS